MQENRSSGAKQTGMGWLQGRRGIGRARVAAAVCGLIVLLGLQPALGQDALSSASGYERPGQTERVSVGSDGDQGEGNSYSPSLSADGRYVAFISAASNFAPGSPSGRRHILVRDRVTGVTEVASVSSEGVLANGNAFSPSVSADGRYVAFQSGATNLAPGITGGGTHVYLRDRVAGTTVRVSVTATGQSVGGTHVNAAVSADGRYVAFASNGATFVPGGTSDTYDIYVKDLQSGAVEFVSVARDGGPADNNSYSPAISDDGLLVAFTSHAANLVEGDLNRDSDAFVRDRVSGTTTLVSVASDGTRASQAAQSATISGDGRYVAFQSVASNLVPADANVNWDVFVHDLHERVTERVSVSSTGEEGDASSISPSLSEDGRYVAFTSFSTNLAPGDGDHAWHTYVHDRHTGTTERVSVSHDGTAAGDGLGHPAVSMPKRYVSADGRHVAFWSESGDLVPGDTNDVWDVFVRDRGPDVGIGGLAASTTDTFVAGTGWVTFSGAVVSSATGEPAAGTLHGAGLTGASLTYRPEPADLLARLALAPFIGPPRLGLVYGVAFEAGGTAFEVRATTALAPPPTSGARAALYRCDPDCTEDATLAAGVGTAGHEVRVAIPLDLLPVGEGGELERVRAFVFAGDLLTGPVVPLGELALPGASLPSRQLWLGLASAAAPPQDVPFTTPVPVDRGRFDAVIDRPAGPPGQYALWARACLDSSCGETFRLIDLSG